LFDASAPVPMGVFPVAVTAAVDDPTGTPGFAFRLDWSFTSPCFARPLVGDALDVGGRILEVVANGPVVSGGGVSNVQVRLAGAVPASASALLGSGVELARRRTNGLPQACWVRTLPAPLAPPSAGVSPGAQFSLRFSEPMELDSFDPYATCTLSSGSLPPTASTRVAADVLASESLLEFALAPLLPLDHAQGSAEPYGLRLESGPTAFLTDLAGNAMPTPFAADFTLDPAAADENSGALVLTFDTTDELPANGKPDLRGTFFYDIQEDSIRGRPPIYFSAGVERTNPVTGLQIPFAGGIFAPLNPLGAKLQSLWRYADLGWSVHDERKYDVDVVGLNWSPLGGLVVNDFFPQFEIRLAHARNLPDEALDQFLLPRWPNSGLPGSSTPFDQNPLGPQATVHPRNLGYSVRAADMFVSPNGTPMMPYPLNEGAGALATYTWRDTSLALAGAPGGTGIPLDVESGAPLFLEPTHGTLAAAGEVPSIGLALLTEFRCYPTDQGLGLNRFDTNLAIKSSAFPAFRAYSAGGFNRSGQPITVDPDLEPNPLGGFNPLSSPPGQRTRPNDNIVYLGQLDLVYRVSRALSVWIDTGASAPDFMALQRRPEPAQQPLGTFVTIELRGATGFAAGSVSDDAQALDAYGELETGTVDYLGGSNDWHSDLNALDGARFVQVRISFVNNLQSGASPALDSLALAFRR
ncbi:MAG: Ig-like domain-containing protein, partial [Planctomycetota bacterium]